MAKSSEAEGAEAAYRELRAAGYPLVEREPKWARELGVSVDLVAWGTDADGEFGPRVSVEVKSQQSELAIQSGLAQLGAAAATLGTAVNLLKSGDGWFEASEGFTTVVPLDAPPKPLPAVGRVDDVTVVSQLLASEAWAAAQRMRGTSIEPAWEGLRQVLLESDPSDPEVIPGIGHGVHTSGSHFAEAWLDVAMQLGRRWAGESLTAAALRGIMARLAAPFPTGSTVLDPFAGHGGSLISALDEASKQGVVVSIEGVELNEDVAEAGRHLFALVGASGTLRAGNSFEVPLALADTVISVPPFGLRLQKPYEAPFGSTTEGDAASVALAVSALKPGGRAVLLTTRGWTHREGASARLRHWLADEVRITALVGLPPVSLGTSVPLLLAVIDRVPPAPTLVADLADDWAEQLAEGGGVWAEIPSRQGDGSS